MFHKPENTERVYASMVTLATKLYSRSKKCVVTPKSLCENSDFVKYFGSVEKVTDNNAFHFQVMNCPESSVIYDVDVDINDIKSISYAVQAAHKTPVSRNADMITAVYSQSGLKDVSFSIDFIVEYPVIPGMENIREVDINDSDWEQDEGVTPRDWDHPIVVTKTITMGDLTPGWHDLPEPVITNNFHNVTFNYTPGLRPGDKVSLRKVKLSMDNYITLGNMINTALSPK
jgi:hypothetical protein